ncbi:zinc finger MYM-type protein 1-like [Abeliophyllum distichum]|uniref:Zinc finger MYM-type protein 1-like n=1 Tax=Abeliophyllum distichum TaxID=126358 RepID=A0ABD1UNF5_9LAMI
MEKCYKYKSSTFFDKQKINEKKIRDKSDQKDETNVSDEINVIDEINERDVQYVVNEGNKTDEIDEGDGNKVDENDVRGEIDVTQLPSDPGLRIPISEYDVNVKD